MRYLQEHPNAADSIEGIARWWVQRQRYADALEAVQLALDYLVAANILVKVVNQNGTVVYKSAPTEG